MAELSNTNDKNLLIQLRNGNDEAFEAIFKRFYARLCVFANRYVRDSEVSKDVVNEVFIKFWKMPNKQFQHIDHLLSNLYLTTKNTALNHQLATKRSMQRNFVYHEERREEDTFCLTEITRSEMLSELHEAISKLPVKAGQIIRETYLGEKSNQEVADEMGISLQTLRNQKSRALSILRTHLRQDNFALLVAGAFIVRYCHF